MSSLLQACAGLVGTAMLLTPLSGPDAAPLPGQEINKRTEVLDPSRQILFWAESGTGAVHVLGLRQTLSEFGLLRPPKPARVLELALSPDGRELHVLREDARYRYDSHSLRLLARQPLTR